MKNKITEQIDKQSIPRAQEVWFDDKYMYVKLADERIIGVPLKRFPKLQKATKSQRENYRLIGYGYGIHWEELDGDINVGNLLLPEDKVKKIRL